MGEIADQQYGYYTTEDSFENTNIRVQIYKSKVQGDKEIYTNSPTIFFMEKLNETGLTAEQFTTMIMEQVIEFEE